MYVDIGSTLKLCCEAEGSLVWSRAKGALTLLPSYQQGGCLTINKMKEQSAGEYTCRATNEFGFAESTTKVIVTGCVSFNFSPFLSLGLKIAKKGHLDGKLNVTGDRSC